MVFEVTGRDPKRLPAICIFRAAVHDLIFLALTSRDRSTVVAIYARTLGAALILRIESKSGAAPHTAGLFLLVAPDVGVVPGKGKAAHRPVTYPDCQSPRISEAEGRVIRICKGIDSALKANRIALDIPPDPRVIIAEAVVVRHRLRAQYRLAKRRLAACVQQLSSLTQWRPNDQFIKWRLYQPSLVPF